MSFKVIDFKLHLPKIISIFKLIFGNLNLACSDRKEEYKKKNTSSTNFEILNLLAIL